MNSNNASRRRVKYTLLIYSFYFDDSGKTLRDFLEALPREWVSEDLMEALVNRGIYLSPTM